MQTEILDPHVAVAIATSPAELQLASDIGTLWSDHRQAQSSLLKTRDELKLIRHDLSDRLLELKAVLSRPGRGGAWSSFLESQRIPRSTADRLVRALVRAEDAEDGDCTAAKIAGPTELAVQRYVAGWCPKLLQMLTTRESVEMFITELRSATEKCFDSEGKATR